MHHKNTQISTKGQLHIWLLCYMYLPMVEHEAIVFSFGMWTVYAFSRKSVTSATWNAPVVVVVVAAAVSAPPCGTFALLLCLCGVVGVVSEAASVPWAVPGTYSCDAAVEWSPSCASSLPGTCCVVAAVPQSLIHSTPQPSASVIWEAQPSLVESFPVVDAVLPCWLCPADVPTVPRRPAPWWPSRAVAPPPIPGISCPAVAPEILPHPPAPRGQSRRPAYPTLQFECAPPLLGSLKLVNVEK